MNNLIFFSLHELANKNAFFDAGIVFLAEVFPFMIIVGAIFFVLLHEEKLPLFLAIKKKWQEVILLFFSSVLAWVTAYILKSIFVEPRPFVFLEHVNPLWLEGGYAFPSGHATFFMALAFSIFIKHKKIGFWFIISALFISLARVIAGVHYPIDIFGGASLGILIAYSINYLSCKFSQKV